MIRISGIVRLPDDLDSGIDAVVQVVNDQLRLRTGRTDLGKWAIADIEVRQLSPKEFQLVIGDDVLHFLPSSPDFFASLQFVDEEPPVESRRRRKKQRSTEAPAKAPAEAVTTAPQFVPPEPEDVATPAPPEPPKPPEPIEPIQESIEVDLTEEKVATAPARSRSLFSRTRYFRAATRDQLRQTGIWPLDRLKALGPDDSANSDHIHTYGTTTIQAGLIRRVCSECGHVSFLPKDDES
jgi:hypothetical protein